MRRTGKLYSWFHSAIERRSGETVLNRTFCLDEPGQILQDEESKTIGKALSKSVHDMNNARTFGAKQCRTGLHRCQEKTPWGIAAFLARPGSSGFDNSL